MVTVLRKPPELVWSKASYEPDSDYLDQAATRWASFCERHPSAFDGLITHVAAVHRSGCGGATLHVQPCPYRFHAVQGAGFDLGVRALGVTGLVARGGCLLMGQRSEHVAHYQGMWEFGPSGGVEPEKGVVQSLAEEITEEVGLKMRGLPVARALLRDQRLRTWELVYEVQVNEDSPGTSGEYTDVRWVDLASDLPHPLSPFAAQLIAKLGQWNKGNAVAKLDEKKSDERT
ncbi:MAG: NUDIX domain-containing protein [Phycisphaerales bacterium]|nr:NUDIX domain-containing protein [Phycisphaerales bacterium]